MYNMSFEERMQLYREKYNTKTQTKLKSTKYSKNRRNKREYNNQNNRSGNNIKNIKRKQSFLDILKGFFSKKG